MKNSTSGMVKVSVMAGISTVLMWLDFPLPFFPVFLQFDFSEIPALIAGFALGSTAGVAVELIKNLLHLLVTKTMGIGEIANFIIGCCMVIPAAKIYKCCHNFKGAVLGLLLGILMMTLAGVVINWLVLIPLYAKLMGLSVDMLVNMIKQVNPQIYDYKSLVIIGILPFNLIKGVIISLITIMLYKKISKVLHK